jgi:glycosyltransferase involved in cell wall biosynthesis
MPYGSDVQELSRCINVLFKHALSKDYPDLYKWDRRIRKKIELWSRNADHIIGGCEWVDYLLYWDTLLPGHFSIDTEIWSPGKPDVETGESLRIIHAPNHRHIKGTKFLIEAVNDLNREGYKIDLVLLEKMPNSKVREEMQKADLVADQFIMGWYAMFAIEGMAMAKPVLCYLRDDLIALYSTFGQCRDIPIINTPILGIKDNIKWVYENRKISREIGLKGREYVMRTHSLQHVGSIFDQIYKSM